MTVLVLKGSKQQIARQFAKLEGEVREAIISLESEQRTAVGLMLTATEELFEEMERYTVNVEQVDYSRDVIYSRNPDE